MDFGAANGGELLLGNSIALINGVLQLNLGGSRFPVTMQSSNILTSGVTLELPNESGTIALGTGMAGNCAKWISSSSIIDSGTPCLTNSGNWAGTWQGVNSSTFYLASNPNGYTSSTNSTGTATFFPFWNASGTRPTATSSMSQDATDTIWINASTSPFLVIGSTTASSGQIFYVATGTPIFSVNKDGTIGIGTTTPSAYLDISPTNKDGLYIHTASPQFGLKVLNGSTVEFSVDNTGNTVSNGTVSTATGIRATSFGAYMGVLNGNRFVFNNGNIQVMNSSNAELGRFTNNALGIATTSPSNSLSVAGGGDFQTLAVGTTTTSTAMLNVVGTESISATSTHLGNVIILPTSTLLATNASGIIIATGTPSNLSAVTLSGITTMTGSSTVVTPSIGGAIIGIGCDSATSSIDTTYTTSTTGVGPPTPQSDPGTGTWAYAFISSLGILTTRVCSNVTVTPNTTAYVVKLFK